MSISWMSAGIMVTGVDACKSDNTFRAPAGDILNIGGPRNAFIFSRNALTTGSKPLNLPIVSVLIDDLPRPLDSMIRQTAG
jgi:hypothetical protein